MTKKLAAILLSGLLAAALFVSPLRAQVDTPIKTAQVWQQQGRLAAAVSVTSASAATALPTTGFIGFVCNLGSVDAAIAFGTSAVTTTATTGARLLAGQCGAYDLKPGSAAKATHIAAITAASTTTLYVETGQGTPPTAPGSATITGSVTITSGAIGLSAPTTGGCTPGVILTAASNNSTSIKGSAGILCELTVINTTVTLVDVRLYDTASAPTCSSATGVVANYPVQANTVSPGFALPLGAYGKQFTLGIGICITGANANNDNTNAVTGINVNYAYK